MKKYLLYILPLLAVLSCEKAENGQGNNQEPEKPTPASYTVAGKVEKGPFVQGSSITMATMDAKLNATGKNYTATITDDAGTFSFGTQEFDSQYARLTASGYFFNEVRGELSKGTLTLSAIVDLSNKKSVNVNLLTHLESMRIQKLIGTDGKSFSDAIKQAQKELLTCFEFQQYASTDASQFSITSGTDEAAALILISSIIQMDRSEAQITEWISKLASDFAEDGQFSDANKEQIFKDRKLLYLGLSEISQNVVKRYSELGIYVTVKDISAIVDWDGDGIVGNETLKEGEKVTVSQNSIDVPAEGGMFTVQIDSPVNVYLEQPSGMNEDLDITPIDVISYETISLYEGDFSSSMKYTKAIQGKTLTIEVSPAEGRKKSTSEIKLYTFNGDAVATIALSQEGRKSAEIPKLGKDGATYMNAFLSSLSWAIGLSNDADLFYTKLKNHPNLVAPVNPEYSGISDFWSYCYQFINRLNTIKKVDAEQLGVYQEYFNIYSAIMYYNMIVFWGDVPYITEPSNISTNYYRNPEAEIFADLIKNLKASIEYADEKKNVAVAVDMNDALFLSKDVARIILAEIYMYQGKYDDAAPLLQKVFDNGFYATESQLQPADMSNDVIFALFKQNATKSSVDDGRFSIVFCHTDVVLSLSECYNKLGDPAKAKKLCNIVERGQKMEQSEGTIADIKKVRAQMMLPGYFAFLKRTGLAKSEVGYEDYQLLWPIPARDIMNNPYLNQNPGY